MPVLIDEAPPPNETLNVISCNSKVSSKSPCGGRRCSCHNNDLNCVAACGDCRGMKCENCDSKKLQQKMLIKLKTLMMMHVTIYLTICFSTTSLVRHFKFDSIGFILEVLVW